MQLLVNWIGITFGFAEFSSAINTQVTVDTNIGQTDAAWVFKQQCSEVQYFLCVCLLDCLGEKGETGLSC